MEELILDPSIFFMLYVHLRLFMDLFSDHLTLFLVEQPVNLLKAEPTSFYPHENNKNNHQNIETAIHHVEFPSNSLKTERYGHSHQKTAALCGEGVDAHTDPSNLKRQNFGGIEDRERRDAPVVRGVIQEYDSNGCIYTRSIGRFSVQFRERAKNEDEGGLKCQTSRAKLPPAQQIRIPG